MVAFARQGGFPLREHYYESALPAGEPGQRFRDCRGIAAGAETPGRCAGFSNSRNAYVHSICCVASAGGTPPASLTLTFAPGRAHGLLPERNKQ